MKTSIIMSFPRKRPPLADTATPYFIRGEVAPSLSPLKIKSCAKWEKLSCGQAGFTQKVLPEGTPVLPSVLQASVPVAPFSFGYGLSGLGRTGLFNG